MELNADFSQRVLIHGDSLPWRSSPTAGVDRRMLDRIGEEVARATSIVRYAPGSLFPPHAHGGGEEFVVLDGVFQDEYGDYPAGSYVRNPPTTRHRPGSTSGCTIFVKLWQFDPADRAPVRIDMNALSMTDAPGRAGVATAPLFQDASETVRIERWSPGSSVDLDAPSGAELLVLSGGCIESAQAMRALSWLRVPVGGLVQAKAGKDGVRVWVKLGGFQDQMRMFAFT
jgi:quercetin dioxygenase-like cupin family protein